MNLYLPLLLAQSDLRTRFEFGRIQTETDWLLPLAVFGLLLVFVWSLYRRDAADLRRGAGVVLAALRTAALFALLVIYLQPQWRNERDVVSNSRVLVLVDTSLSMGLHDDDASAVPAEPNRAQQVAAALGGDGLLAELRRKHDVVVAGFDDDLLRLATLQKQPAGGTVPSTAPPDAPRDATGEESTTQPIDWETTVAPSGTETRLGQAVRQLIGDEHSAPLSGVVLLTDGQHNAGIEPDAAVEAARQAGVPLYPVGIGSRRQPINVRVSDLAAPARAYPGDDYEVTGFLQAQGMAGQSVTVELVSRGSGTSDAGTLEESTQVLLGDDGVVLPVKFSITPQEVGRRTLELRIEPPPQDRNPADNQQVVDIEVVDRKTRVLLFAGGPSREYQFLRNQLRRDKEVLVDVRLQSGSEGISQDANDILAALPDQAAELFEYDCIVAFDPDWRELDANRQNLLERWVAEQAGGLIVVAGPVHTGNWVADEKLATIRDLYPVQFNRRFSVLDEGRYGATEPWPIAFTRDGLEAEFLRLVDSSASSAVAWEQFEGVFGFYEVAGPKPGATVYGRFSDPRSGDGRSLPVYMAGQFFGSGRVFYLGSGEMWRLRAIEEGYFERLYTQLIRFVSQGRLLRGSSRGVLLVERDRYLLGDTVDVRAQLSNARLEPLDLPEVSIQVIPPDSTLETITLRADPARIGSYRGQFLVRKEGTYRLELPIPESDQEQLTRRIQVRVPDLERENPQRNDALLAELAERTGGYYYVGLGAAITGSADAPAVAARLRDQTRTVTQIVRPDLLWDNQWLMLTVVGVLCTEWLLRRLLKLA